MERTRETMAADDVFHCPACGQKHRGDLSSVRSGGSVRAKCAGCGIALVVEWKDGKGVAKRAEPEAAARPAGAPASRAAAPASASPTASFSASPVTAPAKAPTPEPKATHAAADRGGAADRGSGKVPLTTPTRRDKKPPPAEIVDEAIESEFAAGAKIGRYTIEEPVGQGGTGTVYRAFDSTTNRYVALKLLRLGQSEAMKQRFMREIEVQANLKHPNLMPVFDRGEIEGRPYFTMELLYKPFTLTQIVTMGRDGTLSRYATLRPFENTEDLLGDVFVPICEGIQVANVENGVVHRDLKPDNVLVDSRTMRPYVIDFGICHVLERKTRTGGVALAPTAEDAGIVGTPRFLAPEQARGTVHERTDIWGLGAILYFCLTGEAPIAAASPITRVELKRRIEALRDAEKVATAAGDDTRADLCAEKLSRLEDEGLRTLDDLFRDARDGVYQAIPSSVPAAPAAICRKAMSPKTVDRYVNARSLAADVASWLEGGQTRATAEQGTSGAAVLQGFRSVVKNHLLTAVIAVVAGLAGFFLGKGAATGGRGGGTSGEAIMASIDGLERRVDAVGRAASRLTPHDAARVYDLLKDELADRTKEIEKLRGGEHDNAAARAKFVGDKFGPARVMLKAPDGVTKGSLEDVVRGGPAIDMPTGVSSLAPGEYRVTFGSGAVRIPLLVPFVLRDPGQSADREAARVTVTLPLAADAVPSKMVLVVPGVDTVEHRGPPWSPPVAVPATVKPFLMDRYEVSNADWEQFLESMGSETERKNRLPPLDFVVDAERPGHYMIPRASGSGTGSRDLPVRGITPEDAAAFCAWRSKRDGAVIRLPNEAEWVVAAGALLKYDLPGGARGTLEEGDFLVPVPVQAAKDLSPYGITGMLGNVHEIVTSVGASGTSPDAYLAKGGAAGEDPWRSALRNVHPIAKDARDPRTGFRCVREVGAKSE